MFNPNAAWARTEALRADRERKHYRQTERGNITGRQREETLQADRERQREAFTNY